MTHFKASNLVYDESNFCVDLLQETGDITMQLKCNHKLIGYIQLDRADKRIYNKRLSIMFVTSQINLVETRRLGIFYKTKDKSADKPYK